MQTIEEKPGRPIDPGQQPASPLRKLWRDWVRPVLVVLIVLFSVRSAVADWNDVPTGSMKPTILEGDRIFVNKLAYDLKVPFLGWRLIYWDDPDRSDVVVFASPQDGTRMVKRVIGLPGDRIEIIDNQLWVNGRKASYQPLDPEVIRQIAPLERPNHQFASEQVGDVSHPVMITPGQEGPAFFPPTIVPEGHYFVMGDNRDNSLDSRFFGFVPRNAITGQATTVVMSFDPENRLRPRWQRFFRQMD